MKRPTKGQAEGAMIALILAASLGWSVYQDGVLETVKWVLSMVVIIAILFGLLGLARRIGR